MDDREIMEAVLPLLGEGLPDFPNEELSKIEKHIFANDKHRVREATLGVAMHYTPSQALAEYLEVDGDYDDFDDSLEPYEMIQENIKTNHDIEPSVADILGENFGHIWEMWIEDKRHVQGKVALKSSLRKSQNERCANCYVRFHSENSATSFLEEDPYKPLHEFSRDQTAIEVDHVEPLSKFGDHKPTNIQLLCRFCNQGKSDSSYISMEDQLELAVEDLGDILKSTRREIFYSVSSKYDECQECGADGTELTIRKRNRFGGYILSNMEAVCVSCAFE